jgi:hypothetical protein
VRILLISISQHTSKELRAYLDSQRLLCGSMQDRAEVMSVMGQSSEVLGVSSG